MPSQNQTWREVKPALRLSFKIQGKSSTWDKFWLLYSSPAMLPTLVICHDGESNYCSCCFFYSFYSQQPPPTLSSMSWHLLSRGFLQFVPTVNSMSPFMSYNQTLIRVVIWYLQSLSCIKYHAGQITFSSFLTADPNFHSVNYGVDIWSVFSKKIWLAQKPMVDRVFSKNILW